MISQRLTELIRRDERGSALVAVLLLLMMMSALAAALGVSAETETLLARNHQSAAQAEAAAEAGLNRAVQVTIAYLSEWEANGFADVSAALDAMLVGPDGASGTTLTDADNGSLADLGIPINTRVAVPGTTNVEYEARVMDEDDTARGTIPIAALIAEDGNALSDANSRLIVRAVGYAQNNATVVLEATISPIDLPAIVVDGDLTISGNPTIAGTEGSVHANGNLTISGSPTVQENATASGTYTATGSPTVGGTAGGGAAEFTLPLVRAIVHLSKADYVLHNTGLLTDPDGNVLCDASSDSDACEAVYAWEFVGLNGWRINGNSNSAGEGTWYVEGKATISGNPGSNVDPLEITIIAEGSIEISGNPDLAPYFPDLTFVTDGDLKISGVLEVPLTAEGQMLVHEQLSISGNPAISGQILVENATSVDTLVTANTISGNPTITYNGTLGLDMFTVTGWREVR